ncbi:hypothetical protein VOLCADRAFT_88516 [Volvox carteri f. nagariensis]|uniref:Uncharacterized protein n=1 Tax=Volvox carteri f. nagariensis TaxID=3068 RepID=D8TP76_VOLCA|nr:uncharacterized protein VOLCADRAFT_88516 [Volvox carteri f. nagariensis]EFJ50571.1 hypothetical protein VOLCADRAFT_88516 [Volvox carteri f. nagariensis]|eukprot:XP_002948164.1 hypothetical protein VOLCADRAFT_88516 [Volvox carteri f. nagariensis]
MAADLKERGQEHAAAGRFTEARALLGQAVRLAPGRADLHELHAQVLLELGYTWEALRAASRAVELQPQWAEAHVALARAQRNFGEPALAEASYERSLEYQAEDVDLVKAELQETRLLAAKQLSLGANVRAVVEDKGNKDGGTRDGDKVS